MLAENFEAWRSQVELEDAELLATVLYAEVPVQTDDVSGDEFGRRSSETSAARSTPVAPRTRLPARCSRLSPTPASGP
jgi:hypothetical protein